MKSGWKGWREKGRKREKEWQESQYSTLWNSSAVWRKSPGPMPRTGRSKDCKREKKDSAAHNSLFTVKVCFIYVSLE